MPKTIILVRHGETEHNKEKRLMNWDSDVGLSARGESEAAIVGDRLKDFQIDKMYTSDLRRTKETASIISKLIGLEPALTTDLRERNLGIFGDLTFDEIKAKWPDKVPRFLDHSDIDWNGLEGESLREVHTRFRRFLEELHSNHREGTILLVTHSGFLYTSLRDVLSLLPKDTWLDVDHTSLTILEKSGDTYRLQLFNHTLE